MLFVVGTVVALAALNGLANGIFAVSLTEPLYVQMAFISGWIVASAIKGVIGAAVIWVMARGLRELRVKEPRPWMLATGTVVYWVGFVLGIYAFGMGIYGMGVAFWNVRFDRIAISAVTLMFSVAFTYWFLGRGVRYMLGR
jgi:hypothetical protein